METIIIAIAPGVLENATGVEHPEDFIVECVRKRIPDVDFHIKIEQLLDENLVNVLYTSTDESSEIVLCNVLWCITDEILRLTGRK